MLSYKAQVCEKSIFKGRHKEIRKTCPEFCQTQITTEEEAVKYLR